MAEAVMGRVSNVQRYCVDDGSGIRTCVFLKGCPLGCLWCHNPETQSAQPEVLFFEEKCIRCGACKAACPQGCHTVSASAHSFSRAACTACGECAAACPTGALELTGRLQSVEQVMARVLRDKPFYGKNGGLTVSGGEPMAQAAFTLALLKTAKKEGLTTAVETSGFGREEDFQSILPYCDAFLFDCKASTEEHLALTGVSDAIILRNLELLYREGAEITLRCPVVEGANLTERFLQKIAALAKKYPKLSAIELLPYHAAGTAKAERIGRARQMRFAPPSAQRMEEIRNRLQQAAACPVRIRSGSAQKA